jgi:hypothetical protein
VVQCGDKLRPCNPDGNDLSGEISGVCVRHADPCPCVDSHKSCPAFSAITYDLKDGVIIKNAPRLTYAYCINRGDECVQDIACGKGLSKCDEERRPTEKGFVAVGEATCVRNGDPCP